MASLPKTGIGLVCATVVGLGAPVPAWGLGLGGVPLPEPSVPTVNVPPPPSVPVTVPTVPSPPPATVPAPSPPSVNLPSQSAPAANVPAPSLPSAPTPSLPAPAVRVTTSPDEPVRVSSSLSPATSRASSSGQAGSATALGAPSLGGGASSATAGPSVPSNGSLAALASALFDPRPRGGGHGTAGTSPLVQRGRRQAEQAFIATVRRLSGCLTNLPYELRLVLQLGAGIGVSQPLSPTAVASHLHLSMARLARVEKRALRQLLLMARTHGCGRGAEQTVFGVSVLSGFEAPFGGVAEPTSGAVETARYSADPSRTNAALSAKHVPSGGDLLPGIAPPQPAQVMLLALVALVAVLLFGVLFGAELGPRWAWWRFKRRRRPGP